MGQDVANCDAFLAVGTKLRPQLHYRRVVAKGATVDLLVHQGRHRSLAHRKVVEDGARCDRRPIRSGYARHRIDHLDAIAICHHLNAQFCSTPDELILRLLNLLLDSHGIPPSIGADLIDRGRSTNSSTRRPSPAAVQAHKTADEYEAWPRHGCLVSIAAVPPKTALIDPRRDPASCQRSVRLPASSAAECEEGFMDLGARS